MVSGPQQTRRGERPICGLGLMLCLLALVVTLSCGETRNDREGRTGEQAAGARKLTTWPEGQTMPAFSPSGDKVAYSSRDDGGRYYDIWIMNEDGSERRQLTDNEYNEFHPVFSPDGEKILVRTIEDGTYYRRVIPAAELTR